MPKSRSTGNAHYTVHIPTHDPHGNQLQDLGTVGAQWLQERIPRLVHDVHVEGPHESHPYRHLKVLGIDSPETDSHVKNVGTDLAQMSAHPSVFAFKQGQQGTQPWTLINKMWNGQPADPEHLEPSVAPYAATEAPSSYPTHP